MRINFLFLSFSLIKLQEIFNRREKIASKKMLSNQHKNLIMRKSPKAEKQTRNICDRNRIFLLPLSDFFCWNVYNSKVFFRIGIYLMAILKCLIQILCLQQKTIWLRGKIVSMFPHLQSIDDVCIRSHEGETFSCFLLIFENQTFFSYLAPTFHKAQRKLHKRSQTQIMLLPFPCKVPLSIKKWLIKVTSYIYLLRHNNSSKRKIK